MAGKSYAPPCNYIAKTVRMQYHHHELYPAGVNFDKEAVGAKLAREGGFGSLFGSFESFEYVQNFGVL